MHLSTEAVSNARSGRLTVAGPEFRQIQLAWAEPSGTRCQVSLTWRVMERQWPIGFFNKKDHFVLIASEPAIRVAIVRYREWNCSCSN
jgi:hypothetical protein